MSSTTIRQRSGTVVVPSVAQPVRVPPEVVAGDLVERMPPFPVRPITVDQFLYLVEIGFYSGVRVEMLDGFVVDKMTHGTLASAIISILADILRTGLPEAYLVRTQLPLKLREGVPEPDLAIVSGPHTRYRKSHPTAEETPVLIEVSDSSLAKDRGSKLQMYARNSIREYWIVNCVDRCLEVYTNPSATTAQPHYKKKSVLGIDDIATLRIKGQPPVEIAIATLFG